MLRPSRVMAIVRYELAMHMTGRPALRLLGVAVALMLPASTVSIPSFGSADPASSALTEPAKIAVRGQIPPALASKLTQDDNSPYEIRDNGTITVVAPAVAPDLREALDSLDGNAKLELRNFPLVNRFPGRSLLIAILAVSLLTGPLAEALPGERARRTLEVLLTTGISRGELIGGKWLAWTGTAVVTAGVASGIALWRGLQPAGWWLAGIPLFIASAVAIGLWLVRLVDDVVGGSAAPMRVLPVLATFAAILAGVVAKTSPVAAAAVPLGGPLLVAADLFRSPAQVLAAAAGTSLFVTALLWRTGSELDRVDTYSTPTRWGALGLCGIAIVLWWLTVAGPAVWIGGGAAASSLVTSLPRSMTVGAIALLACAAIAVARDSRGVPAVAAATPSIATTVLITLLVGVALATSGALPVGRASMGGPTIQAMVARLHDAAVPLATSGALAAAGLFSIFAQTVLFRAVALPRLGWILASLLWALAVCPLSPWLALAASGALGLLAHRFGWKACLAAHAIWAAGASLGLGMESGSAAVALQTVALIVALVAARPLDRAPTRHQL